MIRKPGKAIRRGLQELAAHTKYGPKEFGLNPDCRNNDRDKKTWSDIQKAVAWVEKHCTD